MKRISILALVLVSLLSRAEDAVVTLAWDWTPSGTNPISGFTVYYAPTNQPFPQPPGGLSNNVSPTLKTITLTNVAPGIYGFAVTAYINQNVGGGITRVESAPSNVIFYTNRFFGPINLRITGATNQQAAIWVERTSASLIVQWSADLTNWRGWAAVQSLDVTNPLGEAIFLAGVKPDAVQYWRAVSPQQLTFSPASLPAGLRLSPNSPPIPTK